MKYPEEKNMALIAILAAFLVSSHGMSGQGPTSFFGTYFYWFIRILAQAMLFFGARAIIENYAPKSLSFLTITISAILVSHIPFVLSVTAMDIALGYPELGIEISRSNDQSRIPALILELLYLLDNHIALCLLLTIPRWIEASSQRVDSTAESLKPGTLISAIEPELEGDVIWVEAQEHYVRITTPHENRMVLARFSDIIRELAGADGMQVHRSHWVARSAIARQEKSGQSLNLILITGDKVPVSRSFKSQLASKKSRS